MKERIDSRREDRLYLEFGLEGGSGTWTFHLKHQAISLSIDSSTVFTFDREGRLFAAFAEGKNYRRGLDGRILEKYRVLAEGQRLRQRRFLDPVEQAGLMGCIRARLQQLARALGRGQLVWRGEPPAESRARLEGWLERLLKWDAEALEAESRQFHRIYYPVSILPPDQYMALVVQAVQGCPWNRCTFCALYRDRSYHIKSRPELQAHLVAIREFLGQGIRLRRSVFLGDANILTLSPEQLLDTFALVRRVFAGAPAPPQLVDRFAGFTDIFGMRHHSAGALRTLHQEGLQRLYVGLETGSDSLRQVLHKPGTAAQAVEAVREIRRAGIGVGVIVILGLGGAGRAAAHEEDTIRALNAMQLGPRDLIYFSPLVEHPHSGYAHQAEELGFARMGLPALSAQQERMEAGLHVAALAPRTALYDIRDYVY